MQGDFNRKKTHCFRGHELTPDNVYITPSRGGRQCLLCRNARKKAWQAEKLYGVTDRDALLASQGYACAICGRTDCEWKKSFTDGWHIDHPHDKPGTHRGVLCARCNTALGHLEPLIGQVIAYLEKHGTFNSQNHRHDGMGEAPFVES